MSDYELLENMYRNNRFSPNRQAILKELERRGELEAGLKVLESNKAFMKRIKPEGVPVRLAKEVGRTARYGIESGAELIGMGSDVIAGLMNQVLPDKYKFQKFDQVIKGYLDWAGVPDAENETQRIIKEATKIGFGSGFGAGVAGQVARRAPGITAQVSRQMAAQPGQQIAGGAGAGAASQQVKEEGGGPVEQIGAGLLGGMLGARTAGLAKADIRPSDVRRSMEEAEKRGIDVLTSDIAPPRTVFGKTAQASGERIPFAGTGEIRKRQWQQRQDAIKTSMSDLGLEDMETDVAKKAMDDLVEKNKKIIDLFTQKKGEVFKNLVNKGSVPVDRTIETLDNKIEWLNEIDPNSKLIPFFSNIRKNLTNKPISIVDEIRKDIGDALKKDADLAGVKKRGENIANDVYAALKEDMGDFIKEKGNPRDFNKWKATNLKLSKFIGDTKNNVFRRVLAQGEMTPEVVEKMIFSQRPSDVKLLYSKLSATGRAAVRQAIIKRAVEKSGGIKDLSPRKFATQIDKLSKPLGVFFKGVDKKEVEGLKMALDITRRASESGVMTQTGMQAVPFVGGAVLYELFGDIGGAIVGGIGLGTAARIIESKPVRNIVLKLPTVVAGSAEEATLMKRLFAAMQHEYDKIETKRERRTRRKE